MDIKRIKEPPIGSYIQVYFYIDEEYLCRYTGRDEISFYVLPLASTSIESTLKIEELYISDILWWSKVELIDLPLYLGWTYKSNYFSYLLKNATYPTIA